MLLRSAAIGVRSSWEASATRWRWASIERSSASSVSLKLAARRRISTAPVSSSRTGSSSELVTRSVWRTKRSIGRSAEREIARPNASASATPAPISSPYGSSSPCSDGVVLGQRQRDLNDVVVVGVPRRVDLDVGALYMRFGEEAARAGARHVQHTIFPVLLLSA